jgi:hypothetical protein
MSLLAFDTTEMSHDTTSTVTLHTFTLNPSVGEDVPLLVTGLFRKAAGAAASWQGGLLINGTNLDPSGGGSTQLALFSTDAADRAEHGYFEYQIGPRRTNYEQAHGGWQRKRHSAGSSVALSMIQVDMPVATIATIGIRARFNSLATTGFVRDVRVYAVGLP